MEELLLMTGGNKVKEEEATVVCRFASANYYYYKLVSCVIHCPLPDLLPRWLPVCTQHLPICQYRALPKVQFVGNPRDGPKRLFTSFSIAAAGWSSAYVHQQCPTTIHLLLQSSVGRNSCHINLCVQLRLAHCLLRLLGVRQSYSFGSCRLLWLLTLPLVSCIITVDHSA